MNSDDIIRMLSNLPTESIKSVKVTPSLGVRDDKGKGRRSAIHITLAETDKDFYSGQASLSPQYNFETSRFSGDMSATFGYFDRKFSSLTFFAPNVITEKTEASLYLENSSEHQVSDICNYGFTLDQSLVYNISESHCIGLGFDAFYKPEDRRKMSSHTSSGLDYSLDISETMNHQDIFLNYLWKFGKRGSSLKVAADYMRKERYMEYDYSGEIYGFHDTYDAQTRHSYGAKAEAMFDISDVFNLTAGIDYTGAIADIAYIQATDGSFHESVTSENAAGAYVEAYASFLKGRMELYAGLRYEHFRNAFVPKGSGADRSGYSTDDLFPSIDLTVNYDKSGYYLNFMYDRSVNRPLADEYDSYTTRSGANIYYVNGYEGNRPSYENELALTQFIGGSHSVGLSYVWSENNFEDFIYQHGDDMFVMSKNMGMRHCFAVRASSMFWIAKDIMRCSLGASGEYNRYKYEGGIFNSIDYSVNGSFYFYLPKSWSMHVSAWYSDPRRTVSTESSESWAVNAGFGKSFKKGWSLSVSLTQFLQDKCVTTISTEQDVFYKDVYKKNWGSVSFTLSYKFNSFKGSRAGNIRQVRERADM